MTVSFDTYRNLDMPGLNHRRVDVWVPPAYHADAQKRFPVLYMHDGQNIFRSRPSIGSGWQVAETLTALAEQGLVEPPIVVGMTSTLNRLGDYLPEKPYHYPGVSEAVREYLHASFRMDTHVVSDLYLQWMVSMVKPLVDSTYRTLTQPEHTAVMGSSMGGLISLYALCEYPEVFGMAGCLSTHWPVLGEAMLAYTRQELPEPGAHKLYFDYGTEGLDAEYGPWQDKMDKLFQEKGYTANRDYASWAFPGDSHHETYWAKRLHIPLTFFFGTSA